MNLKDYLTIVIPIIKQIDNTLYLNSGDWAEDFSYISLNKKNERN
jgi:hypothetical protein